MNYNIYTQASGLVITFVILLLFIAQRKMKIRREYHFLRCILSTALVLILDIAATILNTDYPDNNIYTIYVNRAYLLATILAVFTTVLYITAEAFPRKKYYIVFWITVLIFLGLAAYIGNPYLSTNTITHEQNSVFTSGSATTATYIAAFIGIIYILVLSIAREKSVGHKQAVAIRIWMLLWSAFAITQFFIKFLLICSFALSLGLMIMYISIETLESTSDQSTGLFNWHGYVTYLNERKKEQKPCPIVYIKALESIKIIDDKTLNQSLEMFNESLKMHYGIIPVKLQREYVIILRKISIDSFMGFWERERQINMVVSTYYYPLYMKDATELENEADLSSLVDIAADYINKTEEDYIEIDASMLNDHYQNLKMVNLIEQSMKDDRVVVFFQPIYNLETEKFTSAEALVRIENEDGSLIPPGLFVPIAEKNGMIHKLDEIVFEKVCQFISSRNMENLGLSYIEVNLSVAQLCDDTLYKKYIDIMKRNKTKPCYINLEVTESAELMQRKNLMKNMKKLMDYGVTFSLDDYGTGYSNLNYIVDMPVSIIKFDKVMIDTYFGMGKPVKGKNAQEAAKAATGRAITLMNASIGMFHGMGLHIVAEGVEKEEEVISLRKLHVSYIQGYYYSKPISADEFVKFLDEKNNGIIEIQDK